MTRRASQSDRSRQRGRPQRGRPSEARALLDATTVAKAFVALLFLVSIVASVQLLRAEGTAVLVRVVATLYVTSLLVVGVFRDVTGTQWWRAAFFGGMLVYGLVEYLRAGGWFNLLFVVAGAAMLVALAFERR